MDARNGICSTLIKLLGKVLVSTLVLIRRHNVTVIIRTRNLEHISPDWCRNNLYLSSGKLWNIEDISPRDFTLVGYNISQKDYSKTLKLLKLTIVALEITGLRENTGY